MPDFLKLDTEANIVGQHVRAGIQNAADSIADTIRASLADVMRRKHSVTFSGFSGKIGPVQVENLSGTVVYESAGNSEPGQ